jgi:hypothetical protein
MKRIATSAAAATTAVTAMAAALWLAVPAGASPAVSGTENLQIVNTSATSNTSSVIATGVFTAGGVDHGGNKVDTIVFSNGSFKVAHTGPSKQSFNPKTCLLTVTGSGTFKITGGTGAYAKISGSGTYKLNIMAVAPKVGGKCSKTQPPTAFQQIINATGKVRL